MEEGGEKGTGPAGAWSLMQMTEQMKNGFLKKVELQAEINRLKHGEGSRRPEAWAMIAASHMGHLMEAVLRYDSEAVEKELLHVAAPLLELYLEVCNGTAEVQNK